MACYVDTCRPRKDGAVYCHLFEDEHGACGSDPGMDQVARAVGLNKRQAHHRNEEWRRHYRLSMKQRHQAVQRGAYIVSDEQAINIARARQAKEAAPSGDDGGQRALV